VLDGYEGDRFAVGEIHVFDWKTWAGYYGKHLDELHMPFNFSLVWAPWEAQEIRSRVDAMEAVLPAGAWPNYVLGNHDEKRLATRFGPQRARVATMLLLTLRGTPTLYYGDEIGLPQADIPDERQQDPWGRQVPGQGRDGCRTPMQWDPGSWAGFTESGATPWLEPSPDAATRNVEQQLADESSLLNLSRTLLRLRRETPALREGDYRALDSPEGVFAFERRLGADRITVALNFTDTARILHGVSGGIVCSTDVTRPKQEIDGGLVLGPDEGVIVSQR
jgi:alpha-glucosidase